MRFYYEFNENEYYALIVVTEDEHDLRKNSYKKATEIYVENVSGDSVEEVLDEAEPNLRTKEYAFMTVMHDPHVWDTKVKNVIDKFESMENGVLLVDASLL